MFMELYGEEGGRRQGWPGEGRGESKRERQIQPVISSISVLHLPKHTKRFTELSREEKGEGGDRGNLVGGREEIEATWWRKRKVQRRREQSSQ